MVEEHEQYRAFRQAILDELGTRGKRLDPFLTDDVSDIAQARLIITRFRAEVAHRAPALMARSEAQARLVRRALRLADSVNLTPSGWASTREWAFIFLPVRLCVQRAQQLLRSAGTPEGRQCIFKLHVGVTLGSQFRHYNESLDIALRWFKPPQSVQELEALRYAPRENLQIAHHLGLTGGPTLHKFLQHPHFRDSRPSVLLLVQEGVIRSHDELSWAATETIRSSRIGVTWSRHMRAVVRALMACNLGREQITMSVLRNGDWYWPPIQPMETLNALSDAGITDLTTVLTATGDRLWRTPLATWRFLIDELEVRTVDQLVPYKALLDCRHQLSSRLARELKRLGNGPTQLEEGQRLFAWLDPDRVNEATFIRRVVQLSSAPHALTMRELSCCDGYLREGGSNPADTEKLCSFLRTLADLGLGDASSVLAFQDCFRNRVSEKFLEQALRHYKLANGEDSSERMAAWVIKARFNGHTDVLDYLIPKLKLQGADDLVQALTFTSLGLTLLKFLIEEKGLSTLKDLKVWYRQRAKGIVGVHIPCDNDELTRELLKDAYEREQFGHLMSNLSVVDTVISRKTDEVLGGHRLPTDGANLEARHERRRELIAQLRKDITPVLKAVLQDNEGLVLESLLVAADLDDLKGSLDAVLLQLRPLVDQLVKGGGPDADQLSPLELDTISMIYGVPPGFISQHWQQVKTLSDQLSPWQLRPSYPMEWKYAHHRLQHPLDQVGLQALISAGEFAQGFMLCEFKSLDTAWQGLKPKQIRAQESSGDVKTLAKHFGCLLALASRDDTVDKWIRLQFKALAAMNHESRDAHARLTELLDLLTVTLPDSLKLHAESVVTGLVEREAADWAERLAPKRLQASGHALLMDAILQTQAKVLPVYIRWTCQQLSCFQPSADPSQASLVLDAVVTKHRSSFFAKRAADLCSSANVPMWDEERLAHLVVFDTTLRRLAGMALLYLQAIPEIDERRPSLVIRQINPTHNRHSGLDANSVVDAFFEVAKVIAQDNQLAAVAFPEPTGAHLMSNKSDIEDVIYNQYLHRGKGLLTAQRPLHPAAETVGVSFFAYQEGEEPVDRLHVIWRR